MNLVGNLPEIIAKLLHLLLDPALVGFQHQSSLMDSGGTLAAQIGITLHFPNWNIQLPQNDQKLYPRHIGLGIGTVALFIPGHALQHAYLLVIPQRMR
ncbi:hypothetical protein D3C80_1412560 [compost metagenome]